MSSNPAEPVVPWYRHNLLHDHNGPRWLCPLEDRDELKRLCSFEHPEKFITNHQIRLNIRRSL